MNWTLKPGNENWRAASRKNGAPVFNAMRVVHPLRFELFEFIALSVTCFMLFVSIAWRSNLALRGDLGKEPGHKFVFRLERPRNLPAINVRVD